MIVLTEASTQLINSASARELITATEAARLTGNIVFPIPQSFENCDNSADALVHIPRQAAEQSAVWIGYIPSPEHYAFVYEAALARGVRLLNTPEQHLRAQEFDRTYPYLEDLTPRTVIVTSPGQCREAAALLGLPVFVKGIVQSRKARGWKACVAETLPELERLVAAYLRLEGRTRGRVAIRTLVPLRHVVKTAQGFPIGREYRVILLNGEVAGWSYYWDCEDAFGILSIWERDEILGLATEAARRLDVPYLAVDIGQREDERWIVIETGDAQFSSFSQIPLLPFWHRIAMAFPNGAG